MDRFVAIDFETADRFRDSACAVAVVRVEGDRIVDRAYHLIRPPRPAFETTWCHGIAWEHVRFKPRFAEVWRALAPMFEGAAFIAAHNASFEKSVIHACCRAADLEPPVARFECTVKLARRTWELRPARLPDVCRHLGLDLRHHHALSDAEACAKIVIAAGGVAALPPPVPRKKRRALATPPPG